MPNAIYPNGTPKFVHFGSRRSVVHSTKGMVACTQALAARAGIKILEQGGNAADAAVAVAAALNMTEPASTGIGGDMFCLFYDAKTKKTRALNGSGRSGSKYTAERMRQALNIPDGEFGAIPEVSVYAVNIPGCAKGWCDTVETFGSGRVSMEQILTPAIELGEEGFPVAELSAVLWRNSEKNLKNASPNFKEMLKADKRAKDGYRAPEAGEMFYNKNLAETFRTLAREGAKGFYEGRIAEEIVKVVNELGGFLELDDLKRYAEEGNAEVEPISIKYSGQGIAEPVELWEHPPNGQGLVALIALGVFQEMEKAGKIPQFRHEDHNSAEYLHAVIEALRLGFSDGTWFITDPSVGKIPVEELLSPAYLKERAALFSPDSIIQGLEHGDPTFNKSDTVYLSVTDPEGNAASFINSNFCSFGSCIIPKGTGFTLQNRQANFALHPPHHPNILAPNKRTYHTIIPAMLTNVKDGSLNACYGVMGGFMQPQGHVQVLMNMLVFGLNPQQALDSPRICIETPGMAFVDKESSGRVFIESGIPNETVEALRKLGHNMVVLDEFHRFHVFGRGQVIRRTVDEDGKAFYSAGSDLRGDGAAIPL